MMGKVRELRRIQQIDSGNHGCRLLWREGVGRRKISTRDVKYPGRNEAVCKRLQNAVC